jgi:hypothetical protein
MPPSDAICMPVDATASGAFPCMSSLWVSAISDAEKGFSSTRKLPPVGLTVFQQHIYRLSSAVLLAGTDQQRFTWCPRVVVISRFVCAGPVATGFTVTSSGSCSECSA